MKNTRIEAHELKEGDQVYKRIGTGTQELYFIVVKIIHLIHEGKIAYEATLDNTTLTDLVDPNTEICVKSREELSKERGEIWRDMQKKLGKE